MNVLLPGGGLEMGIHSAFLKMKVLVLRKGGEQVHFF